VQGAEVKTIPGATHFLPMEYPEVIVREALDFFGGDEG
jgi:pimeloyl-ACP methyl ester carboxylesterase